MSVLEEDLADKVHSVFQQELSADTLHTMKRNIMDAYAGICGGLRDQTMLRRFDALAEDALFESGLTIWGVDKTAAVSDVLFMNSILARQSDLLNTYMSPNNMGGNHPSDHVAMLLTMGDWRGATGEELLLWTHAAFWLSGTFANYYNPEPDNFDHDAPAIFTTALAIGIIMGLSRDEMVRAQRIAGMLGMDGNQAALGEVTDWKHCTYAACALRGLTAVRLAKAGFEAPPDIYGGDAGTDAFWRHTESMFDTPVDLGSIIFKRWPGLVYCQTPIDVAQDLAPQIADLNTVVSIEVSTYRQAAANAAFAAAMRPDTYSARTHSIPYCVATALQKPVELSDFADLRSEDPVVQHLLSTVTVSVDDEMDAYYESSGGGPCSITVTLSDGSSISASRNQPVGDPADPLTDAQIEEKLRNQFFFAEEGEADAIVDFITHLEEQDNLDTLLTPLRRRQLDS